MRRDQRLACPQCGHAGTLSAVNVLVLAGADDNAHTVWGEWKPVMVCDDCDLYVVGTQEDGHMVFDLSEAVRHGQTVDESAQGVTSQRIRLPGTAQVPDP